MLKSGDPYSAHAKIHYPYASKLFDNTKTANIKHACSGGGDTCGKCGQPARAHLSTLELAVRDELRQIAKKSWLARQYKVDPENLFKKLYSEGVTVTVDGVKRAITLDVCEEACHVFDLSNRAYCLDVDDEWARVLREGFVRSPLMGRIRWLGWDTGISDCANTRVQMTIADAMNARVLELGPRLPRGVEIVAQVHDACIFDTPTEHVGALGELLDEVWSRPVEIRHGRRAGHKFMLPIEKKVGERWGTWEDLKAA